MPEEITISEPPAELYPGQHEELRKRAEKEVGLDRAHAAVLPGALREAFAGEPTKAEGHHLQPVTLGLCALLERVKSPLLEVVRIMREEFSRPEDPKPQENIESAETAGRSEKGIPESRNVEKIFGRINERVKILKFEEEQIAETIFIFTRPAKKMRQLLDHGREVFREAAMEAIGDKLHPTHTSALQRACAQHYVTSFATIIGYSAKPQEGGGLNFQAPSPSGSTGSGGG